MNLLTRLLGLSLFVVLAALTALLAASSAAPARQERSVKHEMIVYPQIPTEADTRAARLANLSNHVALPLAVTSLALAICLLVSLALQSSTPGTAKTPLATARSEIDALTSLAKSSVAQGEALEHERKVRLRAEEDAQLNLELLLRSQGEKIRLGRDLHDGIIQSLYAVGLTIESARTLAKNDPDESDRRLAQCLQGLNTSIREVRHYISGLSDEQLRNAGFIQAVNSLATDLSAGRSVRLVLRIDDEAVALLSMSQTTETLQVVREAMSNSLRHGEATVLTVALHKDERQICLLVHDNGRGFDPSRQSGSGHGLTNMQARAKLLGATISVESAPASGTRVLLSLPLMAQPS